MRNNIDGRLATFPRVFRRIVDPLDPESVAAAKRQDAEIAAQEAAGQRVLVIERAIVSPAADHPANSGAMASHEKH
jgi:hypothetical protein